MTAAQTQSELRRIAASWVRAADKVTIIGATETNERPLHVTLIISAGPPPIFPEPDGYRMGDGGNILPTSQ